MGEEGAGMGKKDVLTKVMWQSPGRGDGRKGMISYWEVLARSDVSVAGRGHKGMRAE